jgi:arylsulfatase A-like enzyme
VPLILWWPGHIPQGLKTDVPVSNKYLPATILNLVDDNENQTEFPGPSLVRVWQDGATSTSDWPYPIAEVTKAIWVPPKHLVHDGSMSSVITFRYQYVEHQKFGSAIYDLQTDPMEITNLAAEPAMKTVMDSFKSYLEKLTGGPIFKKP